MAIGIVSLVFSVLPLIAALISDKKHNAFRVVAAIIAAVLFLISLFTLWNYYIMKYTANTSELLGHPTVDSDEPGSAPAPVPEPGPDTSAATFSIDPAVEFHESLHYEYPDPADSSVTSSIDFGKCIIGTVQFSRELAESEMLGLCFSGHIMDSRGNIPERMKEAEDFFVATDTSSGFYAAEIPADLPAGTYTFELEVTTSDGSTSAKITFMLG